MKIRKSWVSLLVAGAFAGFGMIACSDANVSPVPEETFTEATSTYALVTVPIEFDDATMTQELKERPNPNLDPKGRKPLPHPFARLLKALNLSERQAEAVRGFLAEHDSCVREALAMHHEQMRAILARAKAAIAEVKDAYKAGEITREEAGAKIKAIQQAAREAMKNDTSRERIKEILKGCDDKFLRQLASILTEEQMIILHRFLEGGGKGTGDRDSTGTGRKP